MKISVIGGPHKQASPENIASLRAELARLEPTQPLLIRYKRFLTDRILHKFLTCRNNSLDASKDLLLQHLEWRVSYNVDGLPDEDFSLFDALDEMYWYGFDIEGHPCLVWRPSKHSATATDPDSMVRFFCHLLETGFIKYAPAHQFCMVLDCRDFGRKNMDWKLLRLAAPLLENNYPERQFATYVLPVSTMLVMSWKIISTFIDAGTAHKIRLITDFDHPCMHENFTEATIKAFQEGGRSAVFEQPHLEPDPLSNEYSGIVTPPQASSPQKNVFLQKMLAHSPEKLIKAAWQQAADLVHHDDGSSAAAAAAAAAAAKDADEDSVTGSGSTRALAAAAAAKGGSDNAFDEEQDGNELDIADDDDGEDSDITEDNEEESEADYCDDMTGDNDYENGQQQQQHTQSSGAADRTPTAAERAAAAQRTLFALSLGSSSYLGAEEPPRREGYLYKQRDTLQTRWSYRRRYFVLGQSAAGAPQLAFYKSKEEQDDKENEKAVLMAGATVVMAKHPHSDLFPFTVIPVRGKPMILASSSSQDATDWVDLLTAAANSDDVAPPPKAAAKAVTKAAVAVAAPASVTASDFSPRSTAATAGRGSSSSSLAASSNSKHRSAAEGSNGSIKGVSTPAHDARKEPAAAAAAPAPAPASNGSHFGSSHNDAAAAAAAAPAVPSEQDMKAWLALPPATVLLFKPDAEADATLQEHCEELHFKYMEALLLLAAAAGEDAGLTADSSPDADGSAAEGAVLGHYRSSSSSGGTRGKELWAAGIAGVTNGSSSSGSSRAVASSSTPRGSNSGAPGGGLPRRRHSITRLLSGAVGGAASGGHHHGSVKESEVQRLRRAYTRSYMENRRLTECLRMLARRLAEAVHSSHRTAAEMQASSADSAALTTAATAAVTEARDLRLENAALQAAVQRLSDDYRAERAKKAPQSAANSKCKQAAAATNGSSSSSASNGATAASGANAGAWILNRGKVWTEDARPALEVVTHLAMELESLVRSGAAQRHDSDFLAWTLETCELQKALPPSNGPEDEDERVEFLSMLKRLLRVHASAALGKTEREVTSDEEGQFAYALGDGAVWTIADVSTQLMSIRIVASGGGDGGLGRLRR